MSDAVNGAVNGAVAEAEAAVVPSEIDTEGLVVDPSKLKHKHAIRLTVLQMKMQNPIQRMKMSPEEAEQLLLDVDSIIAPCVIRLPEGWLPEGVTTQSDGWMGELTEGQWNAIFNRMGAMPVPAGKKTG